MPNVIKKAVVKTPPAEVFDVVADVRGFAGYSRYIKDIKETPAGTYLWKAELLGVPFEWEAVVIESRRPEYFAWTSTSGVFNRGSFTLKPSGAGTEITFEMEYRLTGFLLGDVVSPALSPLISAVAGEIMENIEKELGA